MIPLLPPVLADSHAAAPRLDFRPIFCNRPLMAYVVALAGNTREVFVVRVWFVAYLTWILGLPGNRVALPGPAVISGLASLVGFPVNTAVAKLALRYGRLAVIATCVLSVLVCVALAVTAGGPVRIVLPLLVLVQVTSIGDVGALTSGAVEKPARQRNEIFERPTALPRQLGGKEQCHCRRRPQLVGGDEAMRPFVGRSEGPVALQDDGCLGVGAVPGINGRLFFLAGCCRDIAANRPAGAAFHRT